MFDITDIGEKMELPSEIREFILNWGEKLSHWGLNRTEAQIYTLLFLSPKPLTMEEIAGALNVARSNVTNSLKELQSWKIVRLVNVMGDRRKHFECLKETWEVFRQVAYEQKRRQIDPMVELLKETQPKLGSAKSEYQYEKKKIAEMLNFFDMTLPWYEKINAMPPETLEKYVKLASKIDKFLEVTKIK